jgi:hypothetical protein
MCCSFCLHIHDSERTTIAGSVIPANGSVIVAADIAAFRKRSVTPKGNEGRFVVVLLHYHTTPLSLIHLSRSSLPFSLSLALVPIYLYVQQSAANVL